MARLFRFSKQHVERRDVGIPFDERGHRPEARKRGLVEPPYRFCDTIAVSVDKAILFGQVAGQVDFLYAARRQGVHLRKGINSVVALIDIEIVHV